MNTTRNSISTMNTCRRTAQAGSDSKHAGSITCEKQTCMSLT
jgi:hypothetical protein